jgi:enamine deaminase RidA (YjgF/YER057c/UK114 family)
VASCHRPNGGTDLFLTAESLPGEGAAETQARLVAILAERQAKITGQIAFVRPGEEASVRQALVGATWPVTLLSQAATNVPALSTVCRALSGLEVLPIWHGGRVVGTVYSDALGWVATLGGLVGDANATPAQQTAQILTTMVEVLTSCGLTFNDIVRTWYYNRDILTWYGDFNRERTNCFRTHGVFDRLVPASTGIGAANLAGTALTAALVAMRPIDGQSSVRVVPSPLQCPAPAYGSSFSRALELDCPGSRRLFISGTASIAPDGTSAHIGDLAAQVTLTMRVVEAILSSRGLGWKDAVRTILYVRRAEDLAEARRMLETVLPADLLPACNVNTVCRDDLLVELELDAIAVR